MQTLPGFRDFYPADFAARRYIFEHWRRVARSYGFVEFDGPMLESVDLYRKKSGGELVGQLFDFTDKGKREVALRPEMTPTLARMIAAKERDYKKPIKWFSIGPFFRYEKQQDGRLREFAQLNCDLFGDRSVAGEAEMIALAIDLFRAFGLTEKDFYIRINDRRVWEQFLAERGVAPERTEEFLQMIDKLERERDEVNVARCETFGLKLSEIRDFLTKPAPSLEPLAEELRARGLESFVRFDATIVRGLAYYTGVVFEVFAPAHGRALAGGGRYDDLIKALSDGGADLSAIGFAIGDVVLEKVLRATPHAAAKLETAIRADNAPQVYGVIADEGRRIEAVKLFSDLRRAGLRVDYPLAPMKVGKQFQLAEQAGAPFAIIVGSEWPDVKVKILSTREEQTLTGDVESVIDLMRRPEPL
jgi:histidyl-tRNA synthetase